MKSNAVDSFGKFFEMTNRWRYPIRFRIGAGIVATASVAAAYYNYVIDEQRKRRIRINVGAIERFTRSAGIGVLISADYWWSLRQLQTYTDTNDDEYIRRIEAVHQRSAQRILRGCLKNGGLYIKLGQGLVNLDHILPKEYALTLKVLQDKCLVRRENEINQLFREEFGVSYKDMYESFDEQPIAAASLAQVFKAKTKEGSIVAVKAQYIDLRDRFVGDITTVKVLLKFVGWLFPQYNFEWIVQVLQGPLELELDFINEGRNSEKCYKDLSHLGYVYVPKVLWDKSSKRILTTEFIDGIKITDTDAIRRSKLSLVDVDTKLFSIFAEQIFYSGFVHADPHPGNILLRKKNETAEIILLDHGLYETVPLDIRPALSNLWKAITMNKHQDMKKFAAKLGINDKDYRLFSIALVQRYVPAENNDNVADTMKWFFRLRGSSLASKLQELPEEERIKIRHEAAKIHDQLLDIFKRIPNKLILVCRNLNAVRSIAKIHGNPIDRHTVMAHCATRRLFDVDLERASLTEKLVIFTRRIIFELKLWYDSLKRRSLVFIFRSFNLQTSAVEAVM